MIGCRASQSINFVSRASYPPFGRDEWRAGVSLSTTELLLDSGLVTPPMNDNIAKRLLCMRCSQYRSLSIYNFGGNVGSCTDVQLLQWEQGYHCSREQLRSQIACIELTTNVVQQCYAHSWNTKDWRHVLFSGRDGFWNKQQQQQPIGILSTRWLSTTCQWHRCSRAIRMLSIVLSPTTKTLGYGFQRSLRQRLSEFMSTTRRVVLLCCICVFRIESTDRAQ
jgi:hypothetical protein